MKRNVNWILALLLSPVAAMAAAPAGALPQAFNFDGVLQDLSGNPITTPGTLIKIEIMNPAKNCMLYEEQQAVTPGADGSISIQVGSPTGSAKRTGNDPGLAWSNIFQNSSAYGSMPVCPSGWTPAAGDIRYLRVIVNNTDQLSPDFAMQAVPMATVAETLQGKAPVDFIQHQVDGSTSLNQANVANVFSTTNLPKLMDLLAGNYISGTPSSAVNLNGQMLTNIAPPASGTDAVNKNYADASVGGKMIDFSGVAPGVGNGKTIIWDSTTAQWITGNPAAIDNTKLPLAGGLMTGALDMGANNIVQVGTINMNPGKFLHLPNFNVSMESPLSGTLTAGDKGKVWYNSDSNQVRYWDGTTIQTVGNAGSGITQLTGDISASGSGSVPATIIPGAVTTNKLFSPVGMNRLVATDNSSGTQLVPFQCAHNETLRWDVSTGWMCTTTQWTVSGPDINYMTGNVGIGNASPMTKLHVNGSIVVGNGGEGCSPSISGAIRYNGSIIEFCNGSSWMSVLSPPGGSIGNVQFNAGGGFAGTSNLYWDNTNNRLGIGTVTPATALHVVNNMPSAPIATFKGSSGQSAPMLRVMDNTGMDKFVVDSVGNVGIGTSAPSASLAVFGNVNATVGARIQNQSSGPGAVASIDLLNDMGPDSQIFLNSSSNSSFGAPRSLNILSNNNLGFWAGGLTQRMLITASGNVGIGTTAPSARLQVSGSIVSSENVVPSGSTADFSLGNTQTLQAVGGSTITLASHVPGGQYSVVVEDTTARTYTFSGCTTYYYSPANSTTNYRSIYNITVSGGGKCYIDWKTGYN